MSESAYWTDRMERELAEKLKAQKFELWLNGTLVWAQYVPAGNSFEASANDGSWGVRLAP